MPNSKELFSTLWVFAMFNYLYADVLGLMDSSMLRKYLTGEIDGMVIDQTFLFVGGLIMQVPIAMVLLSRVLPYRANRWANIAAGAFKTVAIVATLFMGRPAMYYLMYALVEATTTVYIAVAAWRWVDESHPSTRVDR